MKTAFFTLIIAYIFFCFGSIFSTTKERLIFEHIENTDEMESTPIELYVYVNGRCYLYNTETKESLIIY